MRVRSRHPRFHAAQRIQQESGVAGFTARSYTLSAVNIIKLPLADLGERIASSFRSQLG